MCYYAEYDVDLRTNAAFLLGAFLVLTQDMSPEEAGERFASMGKDAFALFRDATYVWPSSFHLTLVDCWSGLKRAVAEKWFSLDSFDVHRYLRMGDSAAYDLHQICPKLVAFRGPGDHMQPSAYVKLFKCLSISTVLRLNSADTYDKSVFERQNIKVIDLPFQDCTTPRPKLLKTIIAAIDSSSGVVAVHCLAGIGRTGTVIAVWIMMKLGWTARECIAWLRIVRSGCVLGQQQQFLEACQNALENNLPFPEPASMDLDLSRELADQVAGATGDRQRRNSVSMDVGH